MPKLFRSLICAALIATLLVSTACPMNHPKSSTTSQEDAGAVLRRPITPEYFLRKSWIRRLLVCASMIANFCRYCEADDAYDDIHYPATTSLLVPKPFPLFVTQTHSTQMLSSPASSTIAVPVASHVPMALPVSVPASAPVVSTTPGTDEEFILDHYQEPKARLENALANAPIRAMDILDILKFPTLYNHKARLAVLYGPPGIAKSTLAKAIAYKAGWFLELITGKQVRAKRRGGASIKLQKKFEAIVAKNRNTVIVIDEINRFFENYNSTKYDTGDTAEDFWTFLDDQRRNKSLYIIGTTNHIDKLPPQILSRARNRFIKIHQASDIDSSMRLFQQVFTEHNLSAACDTAFLTTFLTPLHQKGWNIRDFVSLQEGAVDIARRTDKVSAQLTITPTQLQEALKDITLSDTDNKYGTEEEPEEERRHKENLGQQKELHKETVAMQRENFVKSVMIQKSMQANQQGTTTNKGWNFGVFNYSSSKSSNNTDVTDDNITKHLSDEDIKIYQEQERLNTLRNEEFERVQALIKRVQIDIPRMENWKLRLSTVNSSETQSREARALEAQIEMLLATHTKAHALFDALKVPSVEEIAVMSATLNDIDHKVGPLGIAIKDFFWQRSRPQTYRQQQSAKKDQ